MRAVVTMCVGILVVGVFRPVCSSAGDAPPGWQGFLRVRLDATVVEALTGEYRDPSTPKTNALGQIRLFQSMLEARFPEYGSFPIYLSPRAADLLSREQIAAFPTNGFTEIEGELFLPGIVEELRRNTRPKDASPMTVYLDRGAPSGTVEVALKAFCQRWSGWFADTYVKSFGLLVMEEREGQQGAR